MKKNDFPITEELDFHYLLTLLPPLQGLPEFSWLPELFSIVGYEKLVKLCQYAGGETITIPTLEQLVSSIEALQWFYDVYIKKCKAFSSIPQNLKQLVGKIYHVYRIENN